jgi:hypothetical protein
MSCQIWKGRTAWFPGEKLCFGASALHGRPCVQMASVALRGKCCLFLEKIVPSVLLSFCLGKNSWAACHGKFWGITPIYNSRLTCFWGKTYTPPNLHHVTWTYYSLPIISPNYFLYSFARYALVTKKNIISSLLPVSRACTHCMAPHTCHIHMRKTAKCQLLRKFFSASFKFHIKLSFFLSMICKTLKHQN